MRRTSVSGLRRFCAAAAVVALAAGCKTTVAEREQQQRERVAAAAGTTGAPSRTAPARPSPSPTPSPPVTAEPTAGGSPASRTPAPRPTTARPTPPAAQPVIAPGSRGERVRELQARLRQLGLFDRNPTGFYGPVTTASVGSYQRSRALPVSGGVDRSTWSALRADTRRPSRLELRPTTTQPLAPPDRRCLTGRALCVSKTSRTLAWMVNGKVVAAVDVRFGSQYTPTREGAFQVTFKSRDHVSTLYDTPMPYALFFSGGQAVHYSADFAARGYGGASHGCVNVRDKKTIAAVFDQVRVGDKVVIYR
ncbi:L,D-transpeptidase family protein [Streptomyces sp. LX-29]|uniref:L,D-transpeptidase family protein n=1 Tax=Streptomyces sp. LX-29 TaxID=2900152 RepID=UPI00240E4859|nr:L,D-transpeptidase family protein [Streptomyces sp. LX-29]WFB09008.1 L,D-transpeptidase family protein [Streptomyces sp. LX-29]